ncbi:IDEAL domain-containing protein [Lysinibacillus capsici]|uniref:IDEAL domain-containing protein n=1 Tax=Lysinibacillus capsici TaxID=2115968 RepID=UPI0028BD2E56|nr:IDEAL domain-containing protein [Lysinibacillus capsici]WNN77556.1 IDEAL domain-containing protein [Lysinibacillus capsici]
MFEDLFRAAAAKAIEMAVNEGHLIKEDGILLNPNTINLVNEIEEMNRQHLIDMALANNDRELFMQLTN